MAVGSKYNHKHFIIMNFINKSMLFGYSTRPLSTSVSFQGFWLSSSGFWMDF